MYKDLDKKRANDRLRKRRAKEKKAHLLKLKPRQYIELTPNFISPAPGAADVPPAVGDLVSLRHQGSYLNGIIREVRRGFVRIQVGNSANERWLPYK
jgi:hypothetical protein